MDTVVPFVAPPTADSPHRVRIIDGTLACLARHGTVKTTVDDIARESGVSRATVYRAFPGGRDEILGAVVDTEMARLFSALGVRLGNAGDLDRRPGGRDRRGIDPPPGPCRPPLPRGARARHDPGSPRLRRVGPAPRHRLEVHRTVPRPMDEPRRGRAGRRVGGTHRPVLRHHTVRPHSTCATRATPHGSSPPSCSRGSRRCSAPSTGPIDITPFAGARPATGPCRARSGRPRPAIRPQPCHRTSRPSDRTPTDRHEGDMT